MWGVLAVAAQFSCRVTRIAGGGGSSSGGGGYINATSREGLAQHLSKLGFCVVVTAPAPAPASPDGSALARRGAGFELKVFASGYQRQQSVPAPIPIFCLMSVSLTPPPSATASLSPFKGGEAHDGGGVYELTCSVKCTQKQRAAAFIAELSLGDVFNLLS